MNKNQFITDATISRRKHWLDEIVQLSGKFGVDSKKIETELLNAVQQDGHSAIVDHLRMAGSIPERYKQNSSEEKLYSKYTDALLSSSLTQIGLDSKVLTERADSADVEANNANYSLVADAKAFRLSRTTINPKDLKIEAVDVWKRGKDHAIVVCPSYQLPDSASRIYQEAISYKVCLLTYPHLAVLVRLAAATSTDIATDTLHKILKSTEVLAKNQCALTYWNTINTTMLNAHTCIAALWQDEKIANMESLIATKEEAQASLAADRETILKMSHSEAINALITDRINGKSDVISTLGNSKILNI